MQTRYPPEVIQNIIDNIKVKDYIDQYVELKRHGDNFFGLCPIHKDGDPSFSVNVEKNIWYCFGCNSGTSIIDFVMKFHNFSFPKAVEHLINYVGLNITNVPKDSPTVKILKQIFNLQNRKIESFQPERLPIDIMSKYKKINIQQWLNEGITEEILDKYDVRIDEKSNRIVFPIKNINGEIISIKGRTLFENFKELGIPKYIYYYPIGTNNFLFGLDKNLDNIKNKNEAIIVEAEKGVMKLNSWGFDNVISIGTNHIHDKQVSLLLSLKCDLVFALDKDVDETSIKKQLALMSRFTRVYYIFDRDGLLKLKDSPYDEGYNVWQSLLNNYKYKI